MLKTNFFKYLLPFTAIVMHCNAQFHYFQQPIVGAVSYRTQPRYQLEGNTIISSQSIEGAISPAHPAVIANSLRESELPSDLLKSERFYKNPHIAAALAKESWFTDKEMPVIDREAEKIPREEIYKIFHNAGWIKRR